MVGSDLEYDPLLSPEDNSLYKEAATKDIKEMISGWENGSEDLEVLVAYGGSQKKGWEGMTVATLEDLKDDLENNIIGDTDDSYQGWEDINMGSDDGISTFLAYLKKQYPDSRVILILWDHGFAYQGFGRDDNHPESVITPWALGSSLQKTGVSPDMIGFDACFMADIEFLRFISPYVRYVVASEETEPDHGWDYQELVKVLREDPGIPADEYGRRIIDSYLDDPGHQKGALSLSLLDLSHLEDLRTAFDELASDLNTYISTPDSYRSLSQWAGNLSGLGVTRDKDGTEMEVMVDLMSLSLKAGQEIPGLSSRAATLQEALRSLIIYSRHDTPVTQIHGIGIFSPVMANHPFFYKKIENGTVLDISGDWMVFLDRFADQIRSDTKSPRVTPEGEGYRLEEEGYTQVTDVFYQYRDDGSRIILGQEPSGNSTGGLIPKPEWDGKGLFLGDDSSSSILPVYYVQTNDEGVQLYYAWGILNQGDWKSLVRMDFWYDSESGALKWIARPYSLTSDGYQEFSRSSAEITPGDSLTIFSRVIEKDGSLGWGEAGKITWSDKTRVQKKAMECGRYGLEVVAVDLAGNTGYSGVTPYDIPCS